MIWSFQWEKKRVENNWYQGWEITVKTVKECLMRNLMWGSWEYCPKTQKGLICRQWTLWECVYSYLYHSRFLLTNARGFAHSEFIREMRWLVAALRWVPRKWMRTLVIESKFCKHIDGGKCNGYTSVKSHWARQTGSIILTKALPYIIVKEMKKLNGIRVTSFFP